MNTVYEKIRNVVNFQNKNEVEFNEKYEYLKGLKYYATEKLDGTNVRLYYDGYNIELCGRTEKSVLPKGFEEDFFNKHDKEVLVSKLEEMFGAKEVVIYGEGIGKKIQTNGEKYIADGVDYVVFDILVDGIFLDRESIEDICSKLGFKVVEIIVSDITLEEVVSLVKTHLMSNYNALHEMEGLVCKPLIPLRFKDGTRVCFKVKYRDLIKMNKGE